MRVHPGLRVPSSRFYQKWEMRSMKGNSGEVVKHAVMINPLYFLGPQLGMRKLLRPYAHSFHS